MKRRKKNRLRVINNVLTVVVLFLGFYLLMGPLLPKIDFWWKSFRHYDPPLVASLRTGNVVIPSQNTLVIPSIHLQQGIYQGPTYESLSKGVWISPDGSSPDKGSNTVMAGHRFIWKNLIRSTSTFYDLDKLKPGDSIIVYWQMKEYDYKVFKAFIVPPTSIDIEKPTSNPQLTLYTCTPLWTSVSRLVVKANLIR